MQQSRASDLPPQKTKTMTIARGFIAAEDTCGSCVANFNCYRVLGLVATPTAPAEEREQVPARTRSMNNGDALFSTYSNT